VTELNDNTVQQVLSQTVIEKIARRIAYFSAERTKNMEKVWLKISPK